MSFAGSCFVAVMWRSPQGSSPSAPPFLWDQHTFHWIDPTEEWGRPGWNGIKGNCHQPGREGKNWWWHGICSSSWVSQVVSRQPCHIGIIHSPFLYFRCDTSSEHHMCTARKSEYTHKQNDMNKCKIFSSQMITVIRSYPSRSSPM